MNPDRAGRQSLVGTGFTAAAFVLPVVLYSLTCCRDIFWMDSTELMLCGRFLAVAHPTGYPLLILILRLVAAVPVLSMPFRMNLVSAFAAAGSCLFLFLVVRRLTSDPVAALSAALLWAPSFELWRQATALEVYSLHAMLVAPTLFAAVTWSVTGSARALLTAAALFGLGLTNHMTVMLWVPSLLVIVFTGPWRGLRPRFVPACLLALALPLCLYLLVPLRARPSLLAGWGGVGSLGEFAAFITGSTYRYRVLAGDTGYFSGQLRGLGPAFGTQFLLGWLLAVPGVLYLRRRARRLGVALLLAVLLVTASALAYNIPDKEGYLVPAFLACAVVLGLGMHELRRRFPRGAVAVPAAAILTLLVFSYPGQDRHRLRGLRDLSESVLAELPGSSVLITDDYSAAQGIRWLLAERATDSAPLLVSEHHLAFPWYLDVIARHAPMPDRAFELARSIWTSGLKGADFGEFARQRTLDVRHLLVRSWMPERRVFWLPRDFQTWAESWRDLKLRLHGLCYEFTLDTVKDPSQVLTTFPGPVQHRHVP